MRGELLRDKRILRILLGKQGIHVSSLGAHNSGPDSRRSGRFPEPSHAEKARTWVHLQQTGGLSTLSRKQPGWPFRIGDAVRVG